MLVSLQEPAPIQACMPHRHRHARNITPRVRRLPWRSWLLSSASLGGSLFCSRTCPEQGSHTVVLDGSLFEKEQGGHTFALEPHGGATAGGPIPGIAHFRHGKVRPRHPLPHRDHAHHPFRVAAGKKARPSWEKCHAGRAAAEKRARVESALMAASLKAYVCSGTRCGRRRVVCAAAARCGTKS